jgi:type IV pilus assembly protein PilM
MAQRVLGIDLGAHSVKVAEVEVGFNLARLVHLWTVPVPQEPGPSLARALVALKGMARPQGGIDEVAVGVPGDRVLLRLLEIPFSEAKKVAPIVGHELADDLPWELESVVYDHAVLPVGAGKILAAAARSEDIKALLAELSSLKLEPRALPISPLSYGGVVRRLEGMETVLCCDVGHLRTNLCLLAGGRVLAARTISRGGHHVTEAIRQCLQLSYAEAEAYKEREAELRLDEPAPPLQAALTAANAPLLREIGLTVGLQGAKLGVRPERVLLCGGGSLLRGLDGYLSAGLGLPVEPIRLDLAAKGAPGADLPPAGQALGALALSLALEAGGRNRLDLRRGEFAYHTDTSLFRDKLITIAVSAVLVLVFAALNAFMSLRALREEEKSLTLQLKRATQMVFGETMVNPAKVSRQVKQGARAVASGIPQRTAFDILHMLSTEAPPAAKVKLDITRLEIKPGKTYVKGTADSRSAVDDIVKQLEKNKCFSKIATGTISEVSEGKKQFSLTMDTPCF